MNYKLWLIYAWLVILLVAAKLQEPWEELYNWLQEGVKDL